MAEQRLLMNINKDEMDGSIGLEKGMPRESLEHHNLKVKKIDGTPAVRMDRR